MTANAGSVITFLRNASKNSTINAASMTMNGTVKVTLLPAYTPKAGAAFTLWTVSGTFSGTPQFDLPELPAGLMWDTSGVAAPTGILRIVEGTGIKNIQQGEKVSVEVVAANGTTVATFTTTLAQVKNVFYSQSLPKGIYVLSIRSDKGVTDSITLKK